MAPLQLQFKESGGRLGDAQTPRDFVAAFAVLCETVVDNGAKMRLFSIASGIAVLLTTAAFAYLLYHFYSHAGQDVHNPLFITGIVVGVVVAILSLMGALLLLWSGR